MVKQESQKLDLSLSQVHIGTTELDIAPNTPKTPADEGKEFFLGQRLEGEQPVRVYELRLDPDGGPSKQRSASCLFLQSGCQLICEPTVYPASTRLCTIHPTRLLGRGDTCLEKWRI